MDDVIEISLEFRDFEDNEDLLAILADSLVKPDPMVARITYLFQPVSGLRPRPAVRLITSSLFSVANRLRTQSDND